MAEMAMEGPADSIQAAETLGKGCVTSLEGQWTAEDFILLLGMVQF